MPIEHIVQQGECLSSIAKQYGFSDRNTIYNDDRNSALRGLRPDPNVLFPGDRLTIPDKEPKLESCPTTRVHKFQLKRPEARLKLVVRDIDGVPLSGKKYKLTVAGTLVEGVLPDGALLDQPIPPDAVEGELTVWAEEEYPDFADTWKLKLGHLDPVETVQGLQARLNNLGYDCGIVDGVLGPRTEAAVRAFQKDSGLDVDGIAGPNTQAALKSEHVS